MNKMKLNKLLHWLVPALAMLAGPIAHAQFMGECGTLNNGYGPYDYTNPDHFRNKLPIVEGAHFTSGVESLRGSHDKGRAMTAANVASNLDYTLRAFPNHHRALYAAVRFHLGKSEHGFVKMRYSMDCYFQRAMAFQPADGVVPMIYGIYLFKTGNVEDAQNRFAQAIELAPNSSEVHYNYGLILVDAGDLVKAKQHAERAYELGYPMPGLRNKLKRAGAW